MLELAECIGRHHLPLVEDAHEIGDFLGEDAIHHELVKNVVRSVYKANRCGYLNAEVSANRTFDAIGAVRGELLRTSTADLDAIQLLEQLDFHVGRLLMADGTTQPSSLDETNGTPDAESGSDSGSLADSARSDSDRAVSAGVRQFNAPAKRFV